MAGNGIGNRSSPSVHDGNSEVCHVARQRDPAKRRPTPPSLAVFALAFSSQITSRLIIRRFRRFPRVFAAPKRIGLKSHIRLSGVLVKSPSITSSDVSTYFRAGSEKPVEGLNLR